MRGSAACGALAQLRVATRGSRGTGHAVGAKDGCGACQHRDAPASQGVCTGLLPLATWVTHRKPLRHGARVAGVAATAVAVGQELESELEHSRKREAVLLADVQVLNCFAAGFWCPCHCSTHWWFGVVCRVRWRGQASKHAAQHQLTVAQEAQRKLAQLEWEFKDLRKTHVRACRAAVNCTALCCRHPALRYVDGKADARRVRVCASVGVRVSVCVCGAVHVASVAAAGGARRGQQRQGGSHASVL